ncbi:hypothetical protein DY000_02025116 [Brassica cretica]|uniref:Uncharacterized protein n=1 Tax=Brassica cretica TaxID=69181 RepID=A0ABQ7EC58_BRACR|nr:hypothetical protein DY000_02025116 [Brassica cretica]
MLSQIINQKDIKIRHLDVAKDRLKDKRMLVIIITTQDKRVLHRHGINHIHEVGLPSDGKALKIFCMYGFGQKSLYYGFESLARKVTQLAGNLPLGLMIMGSYFRGMSRHEWDIPGKWNYQGYGLALTEKLKAF